MIKASHARRLSRHSRAVAGALTALLAVALGSVGAHAQSPSPINVERRITPERGPFGQSEFTVTLTLTGNAAVCPPQVASVPNDVVLVIDHSASMYNARGQKMAALKAAANDFIDRVDLNNARIGIVQFDDSASVVQELTNNRDLLRRAIAGITSGGTTAIDLGVEFALRELTSARARQGVQPVIVLLTDGNQTSGFSQSAETSPPVMKAREAQSRGIRVITIGLGQDAAQDILQLMVARPGDYYFAPTPDQLAQVYANVAQSVVQANAATETIVEHTFDASAFEVVPGSISQGGALSGDTIVWPVGNVTGAPIELTYRARPRAMGNLSADRGDIVRFNQCAESPQTLAVPAGLPVRVEPPQQLPELAPGPVSPPEVLAPSAAPRSLPEQVQVAFLSLVCDPRWIPLCLLLPLLLFGAWWLSRLLRRLRERRPPCDLIPLLFAPLALILAGFILNALGPALCSQESVYFWRISSGQANGRVFITDPIGFRPAQEFAEVSPGQCAGCHTVSSSAGLIAATSGGGTGRITVNALDGRRISIPQVVGAFSTWSPDGSKLAISTLDNDIVILDVAAQTVTPLAGASDPGLLEAMPAWSADGQTIAFVRGGAADAPFRFGQSAEIFTVPARGGVPQSLQGASGPGFSYYPAYSPDGRWLAFTHHVSGTTTYAAPEAEIFLVPAAGGTPIRLRANDADDGTRLAGVSNSWATWSVDGRRLAFTSKRSDPAYDVFITTIDGSGNSGPATPLRNAAEAGVFEHLPNWGQPPAVNIWPALLSLIPCLIPFLLVLLAWLLCRRRHQPRTIYPDPVPNAMPVLPERERPGPLPALAPEPLWQVAPTLIVGIGGTGRWVLTHLKKTLLDGGGGELPKDVRFVLLDTSEREEINVFRDAQNQVETVSFAGVTLEPDEMLLLNQNLSAVIQRSREEAERDEALRGWFPYDEYRARLPLGAMTLSAGTAGRRPMARAGLIERLRTGGASPTRDDRGGLAHADGAFRDAALLWRTLIEGSDQVKAADGQLVRVVVVGSLAGGMSGVTYDIAYLARLAARQVIAPNGTVTVEGYFATPGAFDRASVGGNATRLHVNAAAAARELERFQLSEGFPFPMRYSADALGSPTDAPPPDRRNPAAGGAPVTQAPLDGACDWMLFDHVTLFGGEGGGDRSPGKSDQPWATVFASMADVIGLRMDAATNAGAAGDYHAGLRNDIATRQASQGKAFVSAAGSFVYRLPLPDIIEIARAQWARRLFHTFVSGDAAPGEIGDPAEDAAESVTQVAQAFVSGAYESGGAPSGMRAVGALATGSALETQDLLDLTVGEDSGAFERYLSAALDHMLNVRRQGLGAAIAFLSRTQSLLATALAQAHSQAQAAPVNAGGSLLQRLTRAQQATQMDWENVVARMQLWPDVAKRAAASLEAAQVALVGRAAATEPRNALAELEARQALAESRRKQMDQVAVRRYVWARARSGDADPSDAANQIEITDDLLRRADERLDEHLRRFQWRMGTGGAMQLEVMTRGEKPIAFRLDQPDAALGIADEVGGLAEHVIAHAAQGLALHDALATQLPRSAEPAVGLVEQAWRWAQPHLAHSRNVNGDLDGRRLAAAGVPVGIQQDADLGEVTRVVRGIGTATNRINLRYEPCPTALVAATDRTAFTVVREYALMPLFNLPEIQRTWDTYRRNAGQDIEPTTEGAALATAFAAERMALEFERRLESTDPTVVNEDFRALHPLILLALARFDRAEAYACAFAAGWVTQQAGLAELALPDGQAFRLDLRGRATVTAGLDWRIAGLLRFAEGDPGDEAAAAALRAALADAKTAPRQAWQAYLRSFRNASAPRPFEGDPQAVRDLAAVAALAAYRRLMPAQDREARWQHMVMRRSRRA